MPGGEPDAADEPPPAPPADGRVDLSQPEEAVIQHLPPKPGTRIKMFYSLH